jgi:hypothetical protein
MSGVETVKDFLDIYVRLPGSEEGKLKEDWNESIVIGSEIPSFGLKEVSDDFLRLSYEVEKVYPTQGWMDEFGAGQGDHVFISTHNTSDPPAMIKW